MLLRRVLLESRLVKDLYRGYVSVVNVNVKSLESIKVKQQDFYKSKPSDEVDLTVLDENKNKIDVAQLDSFKIVRTKEEFIIDCNEPERYSVIIDIPLHVSPEVKIGIAAGSSNVSLEELPTKNVDIRVGTGDISLKNIKGHLIKVETGKGDIFTKGTLLAQKIELVSKKGVGFNFSEIKFNLISLYFRGLRLQNHKATK